MSNHRDLATFTFHWTIKNFNCSPSGRWYDSPMFQSTDDSTSWSVGIQHGGAGEGEFMSFRLIKFGNPIAFDVNLSLLAADGSEFICKKKQSNGMPTDSDDELYFESIPITSVKNFFPNLMARCCLNRNREEFFYPKPLFGRIRFGLEHLSIVWSVKNFSLLPPFEYSSFALGERFKFSEFIVWFDSEEVISILFNSKGNKCKEIKVSILDQTGKIVDFSESGTLNHFDGYPTVKFLPATFQKIMKNRPIYLPGDILSLRCEGFFEGEVLENFILNTSPTNFETSLNSFNRATRLSQTTAATGSILSDMKTMFEKGTISDFNLRTQFKSFPVHKVILCARSPVFYEMLMSKMKEGHSDSIDILDIDADTLNRFLIFIYTDYLDLQLSSEDALKLYFVADKYDVTLLRAKCRSILESDLTTTNSCDMLCLADLHQDKHLQQAVMDFMSAHDQEIINSEQWYQLEAKNANLALKTFRELYKKKMKV